MEKIWEVNIYIAQSNKGLSKKDSRYACLLKTRTSTGKEVERTIKGKEKAITAHSLELKAIIESLKILTKECTVIIHSPHGYYKQSILNRWLDKWKETDFKTARKGEVTDKEKWLQLLQLTERHRIIVGDTNEHRELEELVQKGW